MNFLKRLTLLDIGLITALVVAAVLWALSSGGDRDADSVFDDIDQVAWESAILGVLDAFAGGELPEAQASLRNVAAVLDTADATTATSLRGLASVLGGVDLAALREAVSAVSTTKTDLFFQVVFAADFSLFYRDFPSDPPTEGAEWVHANQILPGATVNQHWGTATWQLPADIPESLGEADIEIPGLDLVGKLIIAENNDALQISFLFAGLLAELNIVETEGFWTFEDRSETLFQGIVTEAEPGIVIMAIPPEDRAETVRLMATADAIGIVLGLQGGQTFVLRIEIGDSGRELLAAN